jgi:hypothetical protein
VSATWDNYKSGARKPRQPAARMLIALSAHLPETPPTDNAERTELLNDFIRLQAEKSADAKSDASHATLQTTREIIRRTGLRRYAELAGVDAGHLSAALHGKRRLPGAWIPKLEAANRTCNQTASATRSPSDFVS